MEATVFDLEADGLLGEATCVHSLVLRRGAEVMSCADQPGYAPVRKGLDALASADLIAGHNVIAFDIPLLQKIYPGWSCKGEVRDTLVLSRLLYPDVGEHAKEFGAVPPRLAHSHGLAAWGMRLGILKGDPGGEDAFKAWTPALQAYCEQDVAVTTSLLQHLEAQPQSQDAVELEHGFATIIAAMERNGFGFDCAAAADLYARLALERDQTRQALKAMVPGFWKNSGVFIPKRDNKARGYQKDVPITRTTFEPFNPGSRQHVARFLKDTYDWTPKEQTPTGQPRISAETLADLDAPEADNLRRFFDLQKIIGMLAEGAAGWLKLERGGRVHGSVNPCGAVTGRCTHSAPNIAQVPSVHAEDGAPLRGHAGKWGFECRSLFRPTKPGWVLVGADASSLELRCLGHYMALFDGGAYAREVVEGDVHTANQIAAGLPSRSSAKTFIYAYLYGAGNAKLGSLVLPNAPEAQQSRAGEALRRKFLGRTPALARLSQAVQQAAGRGYLVAIDRRHLPVRSAHSALNTLLQSAGALAVKKATCLMVQGLADQGIIWGRDYAFVAHVHDEIQTECRPELADAIGTAAVAAFKAAGEALGFQCPLTGEYRVGATWAETH
ncbi:hypothetical protein HEQ69_11060 [Haematospirillum jordaniae]|uniref:DNA polymerase n=1 Tax=Haematospirillum jordaniae TaxID=1549855 RepID=UPI001432FEC7|nr:DNA polymerase [Haematospirillum jordaniae]NKD46242.1 hypothetical protein [Haematospirillum jordaniae]